MFKSKKKYHKLKNKQELLQDITKGIKDILEGKVREI